VKILFPWPICFSGCGDYTLQKISLLPDPCPLPEEQKKRSLNERERLIYAPFSGVGGVVYDKVLCLKKRKTINNVRQSLKIFWEVLHCSDLI